MTVSELFRGEALQRRGSGEQIASVIRRRIAAGDLVSGNALREAELAEAFGVARNTVREALRLLTQAGLASYEMHRGVTVRRHTPDEVAAIFEVRALLETAAARRAGTIGEREAAPLRRALEAADRAQNAGDAKALLTANLDFHSRLVGLAGNPRLDDIFGGLLAELRLILGTLDHQDLDGPWVWRNRELMELLVDGYGDAFRERLHGYLEDSRRDVLAVLDTRHEGVTT